MEPKMRRRIVSKGAYATIRRQEAFKFSIGLCFIVIAGMALFVGLIIGVRFGIEAQYGVSIKAQGVMAAACSVTALFCGIGAFLCFKALQGSLYEVGQIEVKSLFIRVNTADLPAHDSLVRASSEPLQTQETVLLRAAAQGMETPPEQLVRASVSFSSSRSGRPGQE